MFVKLFAWLRMSSEKRLIFFQDVRMSALETDKQAMMPAIKTIDPRNTSKGTDHVPLFKLKGWIRYCKFVNSKLFLIKTDYV